MNAAEAETRRATSTARTPHATRVCSHPLLVWRSDCRSARRGHLRLSVHLQYRHHERTLEAVHSSLKRRSASPTMRPGTHARAAGTTRRHSAGISNELCQAQSTFNFSSTLEEWDEDDKLCTSHFGSNLRGLLSPTVTSTNHPLSPPATATSLYRQRPCSRAAT